MKKLLTLTFVLIYIASNAQSESKLHFGLKAAPSLAWLSTDSKTINSDGSKFAFSYGLITEFKFAENYAFATGIDVTYRGGKFKSESTISDSTGTTTLVTKSNIQLQYIELPITLKLKTNQIGELTYYLQAGVAPGWNIRARADVEFTESGPSGTITPEPLENEDIQEDINTVNLSMILGGGIEYTMSGSTVLLAGIQFSNGFLDVFDGDEKVNSNYLALSLGVLF